MAPIVYTPTVGWASVNFHHVRRRRTQRHNAYSRLQRSVVDCRDSWALPPPRGSSAFSRAWLLHRGCCVLPAGVQAAPGHVLLPQGQGRDGARHRSQPCTPPPEAHRVGVKASYTVAVHRLVAALLDAHCSACCGPTLHRGLEGNVNLAMYLRDPDNILSSDLCRFRKSSGCCAKADSLEDHPEFKS